MTHINLPLAITQRRITTKIIRRKTITTEYCHASSDGFPTPYFAISLLQSNQVPSTCYHCGERGDEAIQTALALHWIAALRSQ
jgi:hypothetical protein